MSAGTPQKSSAFRAVTPRIVMSEGMMEGAMNDLATSDQRQRARHQQQAENGTPHGVTPSQKKQLVARPPTVRYDSNRVIELNPFIVKTA
jgi:hypothetical protein